LNHMVQYRELNIFKQEGFKLSPIFSHYNGLGREKNPQLKLFAAVTIVTANWVMELVPPTGITSALRKCY
ncbi:MAG: hypothetical protein ACXVAX_12860, partial [Pseudobdellovibrio sp.]